MRRGFRLLQNSRRAFGNVELRLEINRHFMYRVKVRVGKLLHSFKHLF